MIKALMVHQLEPCRKRLIAALQQAKLGELTFVEAYDGETALAMLRATNFDIGFIDWNMATMTGSEFILAARQIERAKNEDAIPFVMMSREKHESGIYAALDEGGADYSISEWDTSEDLSLKLIKLIPKAYFVSMRRARKQQAASSSLNLLSPLPLDSEAIRLTYRTWASDERIPAATN